MARETELRDEEEAGDLANKLEWTDNCIRVSCNKIASINKIMLKEKIKLKKKDENLNELIKIVKSLNITLKRERKNYYSKNLKKEHETYLNKLKEVNQAKLNYEAKSAVHMFLHI